MLRRARFFRTPRNKPYLERKTWLGWLSAQIIKEQPSREHIQRNISLADIIYVGGGNTLLMMRLWRRLNLESFASAGEWEEL